VALVAQPPDAAEDDKQDPGAGRAGNQEHARELMLDRLSRLHRGDAALAPVLLGIGERGNRVLRAPRPPSRLPGRPRAPRARCRGTGWRGRPRGADGREG
jgi:hypothetical protein